MVAGEVWGGARRRMIHVLKTWPEYYRPVMQGIKTFEIRLNDRGYRKDDVLILREYDPETSEYSGDFTIRRVLSVYSYHMESGYVCMSISSHWNPRDLAEMEAVRKVEEGF